METLCLSSEGGRQNNDEAVIGSDARRQRFPDPLMALDEAPVAGDKSRLQHESEERPGHTEDSETSQAWSRRRKVNLRGGPLLFKRCLLKVGNHSRCRHVESCSHLKGELAC